MIEVAKCESLQGLQQFKDIVLGIHGAPVAPKNMPCRKCGRVTTFYHISHDKLNGPTNIEYACPYCGVHAIVNAMEKEENVMVNSG